MNIENIPENAHWHTLILSDLDKPIVDCSILASRPTREEAREMLAQAMGPHAEDDEHTTDEHAAVLADVRAGEHDTIIGETFITRIYPCVGESKDACKHFGDHLTRHVLGARMLQMLGGIPALFEAAAPFTPAMAGDSADLPTGMYL